MRYICESLFAFLSPTDRINASPVSLEFHFPFQLNEEKKTTLKEGFFSALLIGRVISLLVQYIFNIAIIQQLTLNQWFYCFNFTCFQFTVWASVCYIPHLTRWSNLSSPLREGVKKNNRFLLGLCPQLWVGGGQKS